jgi:hypothetical protein
MGMQIERGKKNSNVKGGNWLQSMNVKRGLEIWDQLKWGTPLLSNGSYLSLFDIFIYAESWKVMGYCGKILLFYFMFL